MARGKSFRQRRVESGQAERKGGDISLTVRHSCLANRVECVFRRRLQVPRDDRRAVLRLPLHDDLLGPEGAWHALQQIRSCPPHARVLKSRRARLCRPPLLHSPANPRDPSTSAGGSSRRRSGNRGDGALSNLHGLAVLGRRGLVPGSPGEKSSEGNGMCLNSRPVPLCAYPTRLYMLNNPPCSKT